MDSQAYGTHSDGYPTTTTGTSLRDSNEDFFENDEKFHHAKADVETAANTEVDNASDVVLDSEREIATRVISVDDDPSLNPWTFRAFFLGLGLSAFGGSLGTFVYFSSFFFVPYPD